MKKLTACILSLLLLLSLTATALAAKPGDTVTVSISVTSNPNNAFAGRIGFTFDSSVLTFVSATKSGDAQQAPNSAKGFFLLSNLSGLNVGQVGTLTFTVNANAKPGTYYVSAYAYDCVDEDEKIVTIGVSGGSVTVEATACTNHIWDSGKVTTEPTCAKEGVRTYTCTNSGCGATKTEAIQKLTTHSYDSGKITTEPTCTKNGVKTYTCSVCHGTRTESIEAEGHDKGAWVEVRKATCKKDGLKELRCTKCGETLQSEIISSAGVEHKPGQMSITTQPSCTEPGEKTQKCTVCDEILKREPIEANGHDDGVWVVTKPVSCKEDGREELQCTICSAMLESRVLSAANAKHVPGSMKITKAPTCTHEGEKTQKCTVCNVVLATEKISAEGHDKGAWVVVTPATREETGLKELRCTKCQAVLDTAVIPVQTTDYFPRSTACSIGPRFCDVSRLTNQWFRFTPLDLGTDGVQTYDLMASDAYVIGQVTVKVAEGMVTINCTYVSEDVKVREAFCTLLPSLAETETLNQNSLTHYAFGEPISIADELGGDTKVLLFICNVVDYNTDMPITRVWPNTNDFVLKINQLKENMD